MINSTLKNSACKLLFILSFALLGITSSTAQTYVSGGIYSNTIWTLAGSPYIVTDTVKVFPGITLTIQPGVVVKFNDTAYLETYGNLYANGTVSDSIIFTSNNLIPYAGVWNGIQVYSDTSVFTYCRFSYANTAILVTGIGVVKPVVHCLFSSNLYGVSVGSDEGTIDTCTFKYDSTGLYAVHCAVGCNFIYNSIGTSGIDSIYNCVFKYNIIGCEGGLRSAMAYCTFDSNTGYGLYFPGSDTIRNCNILYNNVGILSDGSTYITLDSISHNQVGINSTNNNIVLNDISDNYIGIESDYDIISCNTLCGNTHYNIVLEGSLNSIAKDNYWCLSDSANIQATIFDAYQNFNLGFVYFTPFDTIVCTHYCNLAVTATASQNIICLGDSTTLMASVSDASPGYTAVWYPGNLHGLSVNVSPRTNTIYTVVVTDSSGCKDSSFVTIDTANCPHICNLSVSAYAYQYIVCLRDSTTLAAYVSDANPNYTAVWNPGNLHGLYVNVSPQTNTNYTVVVTDSSGCKDSSFVTIDTINCVPPPCGNAYPPSICYVTTDTTSTFNTIFWQKNGMDTLAIDSVIIYRQNILDNYVRIGEVSVHAYTEYKDYGAQPSVEPSFYALGIHDTCGMDSNSNSFNETIFLQSSIGVGPNVVNLDWNFYQGNPVVYYRILRDDSGLGKWHAIDSVQGSINAYTDRNAPLNPSLRYMLSTDWDVACTPFLSHLAHNAHYAFSATGSYSNMTYVKPTGIANIYNDNAVSIYPNPVNSTLSVSFNQSFEGAVSITDVLGQEVYNNPHFISEKGNTQQINVSNLSSGIYIVTFQSENLMVRKKIVKD